MQNEIIFVIEESPENGFETRALGHALFTAADTKAQLSTMVREPLPAISRMSNDQA